MSWQESGWIKRNMGRDMGGVGNSSDEYVEQLARASADVARQQEAERNTHTYSNVEYTRFVYDLIEKVCGAQIVNVFEQQGYMYVKLDQEVNVGLVAGIIQRDTGLTVYETDDKSYVVLK